MTKIFFLLSLGISLFGLNLDLENFSADFKQDLHDENNKEINYYGHIYAKYPSLSLWQYKKPIQKSIYINDRIVTIIEPDLEQAIIQKMENEIDLLKILQSAKKVKKDTYETTFNDTVYTIYIHNQIPLAIEYKDKFDNIIKITFLQQDINTNLKKSLFHPIIDPDYDIISK